MKFYLLLAFFLFNMFCFLILPAIGNEKIETLRQLIEQRKYNEAMNFIENTEPSENKYEFYKLSGEFYIKNGKYLKAIDSYRLAFLNSSSVKDREFTIIKRAECYNKLKYYDEAKSILQGFLKTYNNSVYLNDAYFLLAQAYEELGMVKEAMEYYKKLYPTISAQILKAKAYMKLKNYDEAIKIFEGIFKSDKHFFVDNPDLYYYFGESLRNKNKLKEAKRFLSGAKNSSGLMYKANFSLALIAMEEKDFDKAKKIFMDILNGSDKDLKAEALYFLGKIDFAKGSKDKAKEIFYKLRNNYPMAESYDMASLYLIRIHGEAKEIEKAEKIIDELLKRMNNKHYESLVKEIEFLVESLSNYNRDIFLRFFNKYYNELVKNRHFNILIKYSENLSEKTKEQILEKAMLLGNLKEKQIAAEKLFEYYVRKNEIDKAFRYEKYIDSKLLERVRLYNYIIDGDYNKAISVIEKIKNPTFDEINITFLVERRISDKIKINNIINKWLNDSLEPAIYEKIGDHLLGRDKKLALRSYNKALITEDEGFKERIKKKIEKIEKNENLHLIENNLTETFNKLKDIENKLEKLIGEYGI